jgi:hypothetical protein
MLRVGPFAIVLCLISCADEAPDNDARRRGLLQAPNAEKARAERHAQTRLTDDRGELVASQQVVAGITLPRGFSLVLALEHAWYYRSPDVSLEQLDRYFLRQLDSREIRREPRTIEYVGARPKGQSDAVPVDVRVGIASGAKEQREIRIRAPRPGLRVRPSDAQVRAQMEARRKVAE